MNITKTFSLGILFILSSQIVSAQKALSVTVYKINQKKLYLLLDDDKKIKYFTIKEGRDGRQPIGAGITFSLKNNFSNIYFKWLNPIRYRFTWKDTTIIDPRDQAINNFLTSYLVPQFGTAVSGLNATAAAAVPSAPGAGEKAPIAPPQKGKTKNGTPQTPAPAPPTINSTTFNNNDLNLLFLQLSTTLNNSGDTSTINNINKMAVDLHKLDEDNIIDFSKKTDAIFTELYNISDVGNVKSTVSADTGKIAGFNKTFSEMATLQTSLTSTISGLTIKTSPLLQAYAKSIITNFINQTVVNLTSNKGIVAKLQPILDLMSASIKSDDESGETHEKGYFRLRDVSFDNGKVLQTALTITEYQYSSDKKTFNLKDTVAQSNITFQKYDFFVISVSTGLFYSNATLKGYGVASGANNQFTVTENDLQQNTAIPAVFLNFNFGTGSRYFSPLFQIGADPTKLHPFLLIGGGFSIPSANIAITGGPLWTWNQSLSTLAVGQTVSSTSALTSDIKYTFNVNPVGWYLGIQYNF